MQTLALIPVDTSTGEIVQSQLEELGGQVGEVIESPIGKSKRLDGQNNTRGFTAQVLAMAASVVTPTADVIKLAPKTCGIEHVQQWCSKHLAPSLQALRQRDLKPTLEKQNRDKLISPAIPMV